MRNSRGKQVANERQSKKWNMNKATNVFVSTYNISSIKPVTRKFHVVAAQQEMAKKCTI